MSFSEWIGQPEGYALKMERMLNDCCPDLDHDKTKNIMRWLEAAYHAGYDLGEEVGYSIGINR